MSSRCCGRHEGYINRLESASSYKLVALLISLHDMTYILHSAHSVNTQRITYTVLWRFGSQSSTKKKDYHTRANLKPWQRNAKLPSIVSARTASAQTAPHKHLYAPRSVIPVANWPIIGQKQIWETLQFCQIQAQFSCAFLCVKYLVISRYHGIYRLILFNVNAFPTFSDPECQAHCSQPTRQQLQFVAFPLAHWACDPAERSKPCFSEWNILEHYEIDEMRQEETCLVFNATVKAWISSSKMVRWISKSKIFYPCSKVVTVLGNLVWKM